jgi:hypothetical protein
MKPLSVDPSLLGSVLSERFVTPALAVGCVAMDEPPHHKSLPIAQRWSGIRFDRSQRSCVTLEFPVCGEDKTAAALVKHAVDGRIEGLERDCLGQTLTASWNVRDGAFVEHFGDRHPAPRFAIYEDTSERGRRTSPSANCKGQTDRSVGRAASADFCTRASCICSIVLLASASVFLPSFRAPSSE